MVEYTSRELVSDVRVTDAPRYRRTVSGYGSRIPTRYMVNYDGRWRRVYAMRYGNSGSVYVFHGGETLFLDSDTEHQLESIR